MMHRTLAKHFAKISQSCQPFKVKDLSNDISNAIRTGKENKKKPFIEDYQVYEKLKKIRKPDSRVEGDIPKKLLVEFMLEFSKPFAKIFNHIIFINRIP